MLPRPFADGVWLVELASLADPALVLPAMAATFDLRELPGITLLDLVTNSLRSQTAVVDSGQLRTSHRSLCAAGRSPPARLPHVQILASSREALGIGGETVYRVPSLSAPDSVQLAARQPCASTKPSTSSSSAPLPPNRALLLTEQNAAAVVQHLPPTRRHSLGD